MKRDAAVGASGAPANLSPIHVGTAAWSIPREHASSFGDASRGSVLQRYAQVLGACEINSTFYRRHRPSTLARWRDSVPPTFRFAVKMPRSITHEARLVGARHALDDFLGDVRELGHTLGPVLVQLPPSLAFDHDTVHAFFRDLRGRHEGPLVCEPRHRSWLGEAATDVLLEHGIARVAADPARPAGVDVPGGDTSLVYLRLHGSPKVYWSAYGESRLTAIHDWLQLHGSGRPTWCIFDNTASGAATGDALWLHARLHPRPAR